MTRLGVWPNWSPENLRFVSSTVESRHAVMTPERRHPPALLLKEVLFAFSKGDREKPSDRAPGSDIAVSPTETLASPCAEWYRLVHDTANRTRR